MKAVHLQTEYLIEPMGIDIVKPRFYWNCESGVRQTAYQIVAMREGVTIWDSGKVSSSSMTHVAYEGKTLQSRDIVKWSVTLWDENDIPGEVSSSFFEMGLMNPSDWIAKWISGDYTPKKNIRYPADCFKKDFSVKREVKRARLYISVHYMLTGVNAVGIGEASGKAGRVTDSKENRIIDLIGGMLLRKKVRFPDYS